jgi:hypothetical protein
MIGIFQQPLHLFVNGFLNVGRKLFIILFEALGEIDLHRIYSFKAASVSSALSKGPEQRPLRYPYPLRILFSAIPLCGKYL